MFPSASNGQTLFGVNTSVPPQDVHLLYSEETQERQELSQESQIFKLSFAHSLY
jgi:hypothetical protein